ncbi:hypothetical protein [Turicibacter sanguinis]|nr:hypothetical protein [Turicibacter sanguinis]
MKSFVRYVMSIYLMKKCVKSMNIYVVNVDFGKLNLDLKKKHIVNNVY